jgi:ribonuclease HI
MTDSLLKVSIYTDGGCRPNPGPGGWAAVVIEEGRPPRELSGSDPDTTNNRMEIQAAVEGLRALEGPCRVTMFTDSEYLRLGITNWLPGWRRNGWKTADRKPVKNQDLWQVLAEELERHRVAWHWVKGHAGNRWNERADELAAAAIPRAVLPVTDPKAVHLFAAATYSGKRAIGSWSAVLRFGDDHKVFSGKEENASANRMHLAGAVAGLSELTRPVRVHVYTASDYLKDGATSWLGNWKRRGWRTREGKPVAHRDLWRKLDQLVERHQVYWHVVAREQLPEEMEHAKAAAREALGPTPRS